MRLLDEAVTRAAGRTRRSSIVIEGHTCNIGTAEYNLALGDRRADSVQRLSGRAECRRTGWKRVSYGEERPKYDNTREETRRLNRRAALVVNVQ